MRIAQELKDLVVELDRRYRSTWDVHAIAYVVGLSATTVAKILREVRGPRPKRAKQPHTRRTRFKRRDVMWSSDFVRLGWGWLLIKTIDEMSGFRLGWELCRSETAEAAVAHARSIIERMGRTPLVWKYDHGSAFTSGEFQKFLAGHKIVAYPTQPRAPWTNGRVERDHQEILNWLIALEGKDVTRGLLEREIDEGMWMLNYVKPRAVLDFKKSAEVYFKALGTEGMPRDEFLGKVLEYEAQIGMMGTERTRRKAIRLAMQYWEVYEEWTALPWWDRNVNRTQAGNVSF